MRYLVALGIVVLLVAGLGGIKYKQISTLIAFGQAAQSAGPPPESVGTAVAKRESWEGVVTAVGSVATARGVAISNEVPGVVKAIRFESGAVVRAGQVLIELDTSVERAQLASLQARQELATTSAERARKLASGAAITKAQLESDEAQLRTVSADLAALRAQIEKKTVRAPFAGRLGIRGVNLGQYLNPGTPVTVLESLGAVYVDFTVPQQQLAQVSTGTPVRVAIGRGQESGQGQAQGQGQGDDGAVPGKVAAIDPTIDAATRTVKVRAALEDTKGRLRPGMFVNVTIVLPQKRDVVSIPATAVVHAPYGDSVFVVEDAKDEAGRPQTGPDGKPAKMARQQFVRIGAGRGDFVAVEEGLRDGQTVVSAGAFKLRNGMKVAVNNAVKPDPRLDPRPENH